MRVITSPTNPAIKALRGLHDRKNRRKSGLFLAEGMRIVSEAVALGWIPKTLVFLAGREGDRQLRQLINRAAKQGADVIAVNAKLLAKISRKDNPQMVLASFAERWCDDAAVMNSTTAGGKPTAGCWLALDRIRDPGNLGTILRTVDAVAADGVMLIGECCDAWSVEVVRASMGAIFNVDLVRFGEAEFIQKAKHWCGQIIATTPESAAKSVTDYRQAQWHAPLIILMGNEQAGLSTALLETAHQQVTIPMLGRSDSLNLGVASGIMLYEYHRQTHHAPHTNAQK